MATGKKKSVVEKLFGTKSDPNKEQKELAKLNRESAQKLKTALQQAEMNAAGMPTKESQRVFLEMTKTFEYYIDNAQTIATYSTEEIDRVLLEMIEMYSNAMKKGDLETAKHGVGRIHAVLTGFRKELTTEEARKQEEVLGDRISKIGQYKTVMALSDKVHINRKNVERKEKEYIELEAQYKEQYAKVIKMKTERPDLYEILQDLRPGIDKMPAEAAEMNTNIMTLTQMAKQVEDVKQSMETFRNLFESQQSELKSLETMLSIQAGTLEEEDEKKILEAVEQYKNVLQSAIQEIVKTNQLIDDTHIMVGEVFNSSDYGMMTTKSMSEFEKLQKAEEKRRQAILDGQKMAQALEEEETLDHENDHILTN
jgi:hypothetical protein